MNNKKTSKIRFGVSVKNGFYHDLALFLKENHDKHNIEIKVPNSSEMNIKELIFKKIDMAFVQMDVVNKILVDSGAEDHGLKIFKTDLREYLTLVVRDGENISENKKYIISLNHKLGGVYEYAKEYCDMLEKETFDIERVEYNTGVSLEKLHKKEIDAFFVMIKHPNTLLGGKFKKKNINFLSLVSNEQLFGKKLSFGSFDTGVYERDGETSAINTWYTNICLVSNSQISEKISREFIAIINNKYA